MFYWLEGSIHLEPATQKGCVTHVNINGLKKEQGAYIDYFNGILSKNKVDIIYISAPKFANTTLQHGLDCVPICAILQKLYLAIHIKSMYFCIRLGIPPAQNVGLRI